MKEDLLKFLGSFLLFIKCCFSNVSVNDMTLEEKIGQLLIVQFRGNQINERATFLINTLHVGGIIYYKFANELSSSDQVKQLSQSLQQQAKGTRLSIPLFICIDQEGGLVNHLNTGFTHFPGSKALGATNDPQLAKLSSYAMGQELKAAGINMNLCPVVDVNTNSQNPIIGIRSFSENPEKVFEFAKMSLQGYHEANIITSLKHFPGHGDVDVDSHIDLPVLNKTKKDLENCELIPFTKLAQDADTIMTAHLIVPSIDANNCATLSRTVLDILRYEMHYEGVIISDSLGMDGVLHNCKSRTNAAIQAINAGCDLLILGGKEITIENTQQIYQAILDAVNNKQVSLSRINEAVERILKLKQKYLLSQPSKNFFVDLLQHSNLAKNISKQSLSTQKINTSNFPKKPLTPLIFAPTTCFEIFNQCSNHIKDKICFYDDFSSAKNMSSLLNKEQDSDILIIFLYDIIKSEKQIEYIRSLIGTNQSTVLVTLKNPTDVDVFQNDLSILHTYSPTTTSIEAAYDKIYQMLTSPIKEVD